jgi:steroid delta-isomerase-like uncharacterized protein
VNARPLASAPTTGMTAAQTVELYWRAWSEHDLDKLLSLLAPDFVSRSSLSQGHPADKTMIAAGFKMFDKALPDLQEAVVSIIAEGGRVACEVLETATFTGPMELPSGVIAPTNRSYRLPVASFFGVGVQGLIVEQRTYWDTASWAQQIGIDPKLFAPHPEIATGSSRVRALNVSPPQAPRIEPGAHRKSSK